MSILSKSVIFLLGLFLIPSFSLAYNPTINTTTTPFAVSTIDNNIETRAEYLGELVGYPHMYEFTLGKEATLTLELAQLPGESPIPFSIIAVKENTNNGGVVEVGRLQAKETTWSLVKDRILGMKLLRGQVFSAELKAGIYRVEVSTPDNFGHYMLTVGETPYNPGYFSTLSDIRTIQKFFGFSIFSLLKSSYVSYPLGIVILLILFFVTWKNREKLQGRLSLSK